MLPPVLGSFEFSFWTVFVWCWPLAPIMKNTCRLPGHPVNVLAITPLTWPLKSILPQMKIPQLCTLASKHDTDACFQCTAVWWQKNKRVPNLLCPTSVTALYTVCMNGEGRAGAWPCRVRQQRINVVIPCACSWRKWTTGRWIPRTFAYHLPWPPASGSWPPSMPSTPRHHGNDPGTGEGEGSAYMQFSPALDRLKSHGDFVFSSWHRAKSSQPKIEEMHGHTITWHFSVSVENPCLE